MIRIYWIVDILDIDIGGPGGAEIGRGVGVRGGGGRIMGTRGRGARSCSFACFENAKADF